MELNRIMPIGQTLVEVTDVEMNQVELLFYPENPRVFNALHSSENDNPSQEELERTIRKLDSVKKLKVNIEAMGGLLHPIIVCKNIVLEGNSRLAAYRMLAESDPQKWAKIKCTKLPDDISEELILTLLGSVHLVGQTPWSAFEKACYIYRMKEKSRRPIDAMANDMGLNVAEAKLYAKVYETMMNADDLKQTKWSYYFELLKNRSIVKVDEEYPDLNVIDTIVEKIKHGEFEEAKDVRKVGDIAKSKNDDAIMILTDYLEDELPLEDAHELVSEVNRAQSISKGFKKFQKLITDNIDAIQNQTRTDADLNMMIKQIENTLKGFINIR